MFAPLLAEHALDDRWVGLLALGGALALLLRRSPASLGFVVTAHQPEGLHLGFAPVHLDLPARHHDEAALLGLQHAAGGARDVDLEGLSGEL